LINKQININFKIDTGAQANIIPERFLNILKPRPRINKTVKMLTSFGGRRIPTLEICDLKCTHKNRYNETQPFFVVSDAPIPILGSESSCNFKLIKLILKIEIQKS